MQVYYVVCPLRVHVRVPPRGPNRRAIFGHAKSFPTFIFCCCCFVAFFVYRLDRKSSKFQRCFTADRRPGVCVFRTKNSPSYHFTVFLFFPQILTYVLFDFFKNKFLFIYYYYYYLEQLAVFTRCTEERKIQKVSARKFSKSDFNY